MIEATDLYKNYLIKSGHIWKRKKESKEAVRGISLAIRPGQITGLLGVNGAGKTTTIKMLTTMISPTSGTIVIDGIDAVTNFMEAKKKLNLITGGERNIYWRLTAVENLEYFGSLYGMKKAELKSRIDEVLKIVDLEDQKDIPVEKYSKGMKQRLQIARGLINDPAYLFMDEPTLGLDIVITKSIHDYITKLAKNENKGILITTHYIFEAEELCDFIYVIDGGKIIASGTPQEIKLLYRPKKRFRITAAMLTDETVNTLKKLNDNDMEIIISQESHSFEMKTERSNVQKIIGVLRKHDIDISNIETVDPTLEDALYDMVSGERRG